MTQHDKRWITYEIIFLSYNYPLTLTYQSQLFFTIFVYYLKINTDSKSVGRDFYVIAVL
jgi:hypothetical protein